MTTVRDLLLDADPLRHEADRLGAERERLRHATIRAATEVPRAASAPTRRHLVALAATIVLLVAAVLAVGSGIWLRGSTTLQAAILFEVRLAEAHPGGDLREARVGESDRVVYLHPEVVVSNSDIAFSRVIESPESGVGIAVEFTAEGARRMEQATADHIGRPVAILVDGAVAGAPILRSPISTSAVITGDYTEAEAERIATGIRPW